MECPIKALAWTGEDAPDELSADGMINTAGYSWDPKTDRMKIMTPKIFRGEKKKSRFTKDTIFFKDEVTLENIKRFYEDKRITHESILSKTASLYDLLGFAAPLKVYGSYICRPSEGSRRRNQKIVSTIYLPSENVREHHIRKEQEHA